MNTLNEQERLLSLLVGHHLKGYECIKIFIAIRLKRLKGLMMYKAGLALKRKIVFPLFSTMNVCGEKETTRKGSRETEK